MIPVVRGYTRYGRSSARRQAFWRRVARPYFAWHSHSYVARTAFGAKLAGDTQEVLQQHVYYFGVWEANLTRWLTRRLRPGDTFVDVGANIGYFSLLASALVGPSGRVVAIEALPTTFEKLQRNIERNRCPNVRAVNSAVADFEGIAKAFRGPDSHTGLATLIEDFGFDYEREIEAAPLSGLLTAEEVRSAGVIKIDVEGSELGVTRGMVAMLGDTRPDLAIVVELHPWPLGHQGHEPQDVIDVLAAEGFHPYALDIDYSPESSLSNGHCGPLRRLREPPEGELDVVFSREDRNAL